MKRDKSKIVRWWWWKKDRKRWRNKGLKRWLRVCGVSEVAHTVWHRGVKRKSWFLLEQNVVSHRFQSVLTAGVVTGTGKAPAHLPHSHILLSTLWYCTYSPYLLILTLSLSFTLYLKHTSACTHTHTHKLQVCYIFKRLLNLTVNPTFTRASQQAFNIQRGAARNKNFFQKLQ